MAGEQDRAEGRGAKAWGGRLRRRPTRQSRRSRRSISFDWRLYRQDIAASIAHARMLGRQGIIADGEAEAIIAGLGEIEREIERGEFVSTPAARTFISI